MADPVIWGPIGWRSMFSLAKDLDKRMGSGEPDESSVALA
jgi:hypothetical protein